MAKVLVILMCVALLVAVHVDGARTLKQVTAETHGTEAEAVFATEGAVLPAPDAPAGGDGTYNYNDDSTTSSSGDVAGFADQGVLVDDPEDGSTSGASFATNDAVFAQDVPGGVEAVPDAQEGKLVEDVNDDPASTATFANEGFLVDSAPEPPTGDPSYVYDATIQDQPDTALPSGDDKLSDTLSFADADNQNAPDDQDFQFDESPGGN